MKTLWLSLPLYLFVTSASAAQLNFASLVDAIGIKTSETHTNNSWEDVEKIKGVKWQWPYYESGAHDSTMKGTAKVGTDKNPNIGVASLNVQGARTMITTIEVSVANEHVEVDVFGKGKLNKIKTSCDDDSLTNTVAFYSFTKQGYKPVFISYASSWGAAGDSGSVDFKVANDRADAFNIYPNPCTVIE